MSWVDVPFSKYGETMFSSATGAVTCKAVDPVTAVFAFAELLLFEAVVLVFSFEAFVVTVPEFLQAAPRRDKPRTVTMIEIRLDIIVC